LDIWVVALRIWAVVPVGLLWWLRFLLDIHGGRLLDDYGWGGVVGIWGSPPEPRTPPDGADEDARPDEGSMPAEAVMGSGAVPGVAREGSAEKQDHRHENHAGEVFLVHVTFPPARPGRKRSLAICQSQPFDEPGAWHIHPHRIRETSASRYLYITAREAELFQGKRSTGLLSASNYLNSWRYSDISLSPTWRRYPPVAGRAVHPIPEYGPAPDPTGQDVVEDAGRGFLPAKSRWASRRGPKGTAR